MRAGSLWPYRVNIGPLYTTSVYVKSGRRCIIHNKTIIPGIFPIYWDIFDRLTIFFIFNSFIFMAKIIFQRHPRQRNINNLKFGQSTLYSYDIKDAISPKIKLWINLAHGSFTHHHIVCSTPLQYESSLYCKL